MEIVGVASESDNGERWKKFLTDKPEYQWPQVLSRKNEEDFILKFNVAGFPTKIIVDPNGLIVGRYVGEDDDIYKKLDEILSSSGLPAIFLSICFPPSATFLIASIISSCGALLVTYPFAPNCIIFFA